MTVPVVGGDTTYSAAWANYLYQPGIRPSAPMSIPAARAIPGLSRSLQVIAGMVMQMPLDDYKGRVPLPRPLMLDQPDPDRNLPWWLDMHTQDYLLNGNAVHYVTSRDSQGWPSSAVWIPAAWLSVGVDADGQPIYWVGGRELDRADVVHVQRGADPLNPWRGVGVVEQHLGTLRKVADQEAYESETARGNGVPSVVIESPNANLTQIEASAAKVRWSDAHNGPNREPAIVPKGTVVTPLAWSPADTELVEARKLSLLDVANLMNLDGYWLGAPSTSLTYRTPGPLYLNLLRQSVNPILVQFEASWSQAWLPRGRKVQFDRQVVLRDDLETQIRTASAATGAKLWTIQEGRTYLGLPPEYPDGHDVAAAPVPPVKDPGGDPVDGDEDDKGENDG